MCPTAAGTGSGASVTETDFKHALPKGYLLEDYRLLRVLGEGGFSVTYLAQDVNLGNQVAVKEYLPNEFAVRDGTTVYAKSAASRDDFEWGLERFLEEARILARFQHPNVVRVIRRFQANNTAYIVMDYEEGASLAQLLARHGTLDEKELKDLLFPLVEGLQAVHAEGFLHRDVKPDNVYVRRRDETPVLLDFGAARNALGRKSRSMSAVVAPGYSPPEQYETDGEQGPFSDIYALAALCYRAAVGEGPVDSPRRVRLLFSTGEDPQPSMLDTVGDRYSHALCKAVDWGMSPRSSDRPQHLKEWVTAIERLPRPPEPPQRPPMEDDSERVSRVAPEREVAEESAEEKAPGFFRRLVRGDFGLARTYWLFNVLVGFAIYVLVGAVGSAGSQPTASLVVAGIWFGYVPYQVLVLIGVWKAAGTYRGLALWSVLARVAAVLGSIGVVVALVAVLMLARLSLALVAPDEDTSGQTSTEVGELSSSTDVDSGVADVEAAGTEDRVAEDTVRYGTLSVDVVPDDATVSLEGIADPYRPGMRVAEGQYRLTASREGYVPESRSFAVSGETTVEIRLRPEVSLPAAAAFTVETEPADARVRILNIVPRYRDGMALETGEYRVEVSASGFNTDTETVSHGLEATVHRVVLGGSIGSVFRDCPDCPQMVWLPVGEYSMGSNVEPGRFSDEGPVHRVTLEDRVAIGVHEVTFGEWNACVRGGGCAGYRPHDAGWGAGARPVIHVSWEDAGGYLDWLTYETGFTYRLPSEAEWEYAARAGTTTARYWGATESGQCARANGADVAAARQFEDWTVASCDDRYAYTTHVDDDAFEPNGWGLRHVLGNVSEWTQDCWHRNYVGAPEDGSAWTVDCEDPESRVVRGGNWTSVPRGIRSALRDFEAVDSRTETVGFRVVRSSGR